MRSGRLLCFFHGEAEWGQSDLASVTVESPKNPSGGRSVSAVISAVISNNDAPHICESISPHNGNVSGYNLKKITYRHDIGTTQKDIF